MDTFRFAVRSLTKSPLVAIIVVISFALGVGSNTALFSVLYQTVLKSVPAHKPEELAILSSPEDVKLGSTSTDKSGGKDLIFSYPMFREFERRSQEVVGVAGFRSMNVHIGYGGEVFDSSVLLISGQYFPILGVLPSLGRLVTPVDDVHGAGNPVIVLSYQFWKNILGGNATVVNQSLQVNGHVFTVIGIAPKGFSSLTPGDEPAGYLPLCFRAALSSGRNELNSWDDYWVYSFARPSLGTSRESAAAALNSVYRAVTHERSREYQHRGAEWISRFLESNLSLLDGRRGFSATRDKNRTAMLIVGSCTCLLLLMCLINAGSLLRARSSGRRGELAIRVALGASRAVIVRQLLVEALILSGIGGFAGVLFGSWTIGILLARLDQTDIPAVGASLEWPVFAFGLVLCLVVGVLFGLYPAWDVTRTGITTALRGTRTHSPNRQSAVLRKVLVGTQIGISTMLVILTGLLVRSFVNVLAIDTGIRAENLVTFRISPELSGYPPDRGKALFARFESEIAALPGVSAVSAASVPLFSGTRRGVDLTIKESVERRSDALSMYNDVGAGFFRTLSIPVLNGRDFNSDDGLQGPQVAIVNEQFARYFLSGQNVLGRKFAFRRGAESSEVQIVGVVKDSRYSGVKQATPRVFYLPWRQGTATGSLTFYVRASIPVLNVLAQIRRIMASSGGNLPLEQVLTVEDQLRRDTQSDEVLTYLSMAFAVLTTALALVGVYGVVAFTVLQRSREIAIRLAVGADPASVRALVVREISNVLIAGVVLGIIPSLALARLVQSQLYGVESFDLMVLSGTVVVILSATLISAYLPTRRVTRINPVDLLRSE